MSREQTGDLEAVGLLPAAGLANRIAPLPFSKEVYPVGFRAVGDSVRPKVACHYLLERMRLAGVRKAYVVLREGKWDIPTYLGDGTIVAIHLAYLMMRLPHGAPYSADQAYPFVEDALVAFGFPDIIFDPADAFVQLMTRQAATAADVVVGAFPARNSQNVDMVEIDEAGRLRRIVIKPTVTDLRHTWIIAVWTPTFTRFMHNHLAALEAGRSDDRRELFVGDVIQAAIDDGLDVEAVVFPNGTYLDIGSPDDLVVAVRDLSHRPVE